MFFRQALLASTAVLSLSVALPTADPSLPYLLSPRDDTQCIAGTTFYACYLNHFRGCCSVDPCALEAGCPDNNPNPNNNQQHHHQQVTCPVSGTQVFQPQMEMIFPTEPTTSPIPTPDLNLSRSATTQWNQLMTFTLPSEARQCTLGWTIPARRNFTAGSNALVRVLENVAPGNITRIGAADFSYWPQTPGPHEALVGTLDCKEQLQFHLTLEHRDAVFMAQDAQTGWWVRYTC
ncbi:hypothetical protein BO86DRAFT_456509 [Aspergillus japonicus CBS 114.51]|uniref:Ubiquitin 3 binding protein But2 C-terminal domain-containing protein n=1 Tax=Aspergillus japonicus CBS 114.51 TaxID=1448312 RepID=A0A8T8WZL5_ASPJA|nr:hypothetical protein BO86DRAFT_456509 [Aspergillus japonicus CBS 114.51]RAH81293.1 hypothetical protein BO86DRAFT_456509 [Aspergillus japonicus CBS 114.51]